MFPPPKQQNDSQQQPPAKKGKKKLSGAAHRSSLQKRVKAGLAKAFPSDSSGGGATPPKPNGLPLRVGASVKRSY